jgi:hypothetical protein
LISLVNSSFVFGCILLRPCFGRSNLHSACPGCWLHETDLTSWKVKRQFIN